MMSRKLIDDTQTIEGSVISQNFKISNYGYGKDSVKVLHVERNGLVHSIKEFEVGTKLKLTSQKDYLQGDNSDIVATDSQKNTVYLLAQKHGLKSPEEFGILLCRHFLTKYSHVNEVSIHIDEYPWSRMSFGKGPYQDQHNHAFVFTPTASRYCDVNQKRGDTQPTVISGLSDLRVLKTTQSAFVNFVNDEYRTLPDQHDRLFSTVIRSTWQYSTVDGVDFDYCWNKVKHCILNTFAGETEKGIFSPSVQNTLYLAEKLALESIPEISSIDMTMPNKHYFNFDFSKFPKLVNGAELKQENVFLPVDKPSGIIYAQLDRKSPVKSKL
ncbi:uricase [Toxorhynchites rutilus septentrionalis]|uniref:uricase n=1 Tax=Toxorhynchites rutilus septentrionalis TaxID=329112 RepID=UPI00247AA468|nr:uricase [Toxorhynchites rutilus septentrionalis]XP_055639746.1 uricase [Toxorhynchites rutilus septentrionalis]XP_055639747.1 uricase [Toxorhynchites rutilus septentrionalis]